MFDLLGGIFDFLGGGISSALASFVDFLYQLIVSVFQVLYQLLGFVVQFFGTVFKAIANFFDKLWNGFFKGIFTKVWNALKAAHSWLEAKLGPVVKYLQHLRDVLQRYFNLYIRPILLFIQRVRQFLQILTALHIGFAQKLDAYLAQVQAKIVQSFAVVIGTINTLTNVANALMDPTALLRKPALLLSIRRQIPSLIRVLTGRPPGYFFGAPGSKAGSPFAIPLLPLKLTDTSQNPLPSSYFSHDDGIGPISGFMQDYTISDGAVDETEPLDCFNDDLYPPSPCTDITQCLAEATRLLVEGANGS